MKLHKRSSKITRSAFSASIAKQFASSVSRSRCVALAALLLTTASAPQALASSYFIDGAVYTFSGYPLNSYYHDEFRGTHPVRISDAAHVEGSSPSGFPVERYAANVYASGGDGLARLSLDSSFRREFARDERPNDNFEILRSTGEVRVTINDLIISGPGTGSVSTRLNLHLGGTLDASSSFSATPAPKGIYGVSGFGVTLRLNGSSIGDGYFEMTSNNGYAPVVSIESGWLTGFDGDVILTSDTFSVQLDTPFTVAFSLYSGVQAGMGHTESGLAFAFLHFDKTLSFNTEGDVFNLPPGYTANSSSAGIVNNRFTPSLQVTAAVSQKMHGDLGPFEVVLPLTGEPGLECRNSGGNHTLVFTFTNNVVSGSANVTEGTGVAGSPVFAGKTMSVNLSGVADVQKVTVTLSMVTDSFAQVLPDTAVSMNVLSGDTNGDKSVNSGDAQQTRNRSGQIVSTSNFRSDVNLDATVNSGDAIVVRSRSGNGLL